MNPPDRALAVCCRRKRLSRRVALLGQQSRGEALPLRDAFDLERDCVHGLIELGELGGDPAGYLWCGGSAIHPSRDRPGEGQADDDNGDRDEKRDRDVDGLRWDYLARRRHSDDCLFAIWPANREGARRRWWGRWCRNVAPGLCSGAGDLGAHLLPYLIAKTPVGEALRVLSRGRGGLGSRL